MNRGLFPDSVIIPYNRFYIEVVPENVYQYPRLLHGIQEQVLQIAARSRGWDDPESLEVMRRHFKIGPLYEANALALIWREGALVGLAGSVNNWTAANASIVHLCSVGLLPEAQGRAFIPALLTLLWNLTLRSEFLRKQYVNGRIYITAITQSPYLIALLDRAFGVYPGPFRPAPGGDITEVARCVAARFDSHIPFDHERQVLRNECQFHYRRIPYSRDRAMNAFCDQNLRYSEGDVFVVVGRAIPARIKRFVSTVAERHPELFSALNDPFEMEPAVAAGGSARQ